MKGEERDNISRKSQPPYRFLSDAFTMIFGMPEPRLLKSNDIGPGEEGTVKRVRIFLTASSSGTKRTRIAPDVSPTGKRTLFRQAAV
jgi:hypothetical protein